MKVGKRIYLLKATLIILLGFLVYYVSGYMIAYYQYLSFHGISGLKTISEEFISQPSTAFSVLVLGDGSTELFKAIHQSFTNHIYQLVFVSSYAYFVFMIIRKKNKMDKKDASEYGTHGSSRWATEKEIIQGFGKDVKGFILGEIKNRLIVHSKASVRNDNIITIGGSGRNKTVGYVIPNILHIAEHVGESMVITDPKGEIFDNTSEFLKEHGYDVLYINLLDINRTMRYNPFDFIQNTTDALNLARMIIASTDNGVKNTSGDSMWRNAEESYFAAIMLFLKEKMPKEKQTIKSVLQIGTYIGQDEEKLEEMFSQLSPDSEALQMYNIFKIAQDRTRSGILIGFGVRLRLWVSKEVAYLTSASDFDLRQLGQRKTALFFLMPDKDRTFDVIPSLLIDQIFNVLYELAGSSLGRRLPVDVRFILDEAANIAPINDLEVKVSTMRSRGISIVPIFQTITQFKNRYDKDRWSEIIGSSDTTVYLGSNDLQSNEYISKRLGKKTLIVNNVSESKNKRSNSSSKSYTSIGRELLQVDELERLPADEAIVIHAGMYPMKIKKHIYYKQKKWSNLKEVRWQEVLPYRPIQSIPLIDPFEINRSVTNNRMKNRENEVDNYESESNRGYLSSLMED